MSPSSSISDNFSDEAAQYRKNGYFIARQMLPVDQVLRVRSEMHLLVQQQLEFLGLPCEGTASPEALHADLKTLFNGNLKTYLAVLTLCAKLMSLYELYMCPEVKKFTKAIGLSLPVFQTAPVMHAMSTALKVPDGYHGLGAHQDWPTLQGGLDTVTLWLPFVDVDRNLYPLELIPGSHEGGLHPYSRKEHIFEVDPEHYDPTAFIPAEVSVGDIVFMSSFTIHKTSTNGDSRLRLATSWRYENGSEPNFIARSYPFAQKRSVVPELITPNFPTRAQVKSVF